MNKPRLIDANDVLEILELHQTEPDGISWAIREITDQPTAYDIDKVVEQLEDLKKHEADGSCPKIGMCIKGAESCATCYTDTAIEIVKGGVVDDETMA